MNKKKTYCRFLEHYSEETVLTMYVQTEREDCDFSNLSSAVGNTLSDC